MKDCLDIKVYYEDTDCGGVVYYGKYLGFLERARTEYLEERGVSLVKLMDEGTYFVVVNVDINYHMPAHYGDIISVCSAIRDRTSATITFDHTITRQGTDRALVTASVKLACVGRDLKPQRISNEIVDAIT